MMESLDGLIGYKEVGSIMIQRLIFIQTDHWTLWGEPLSINCYQLSTLNQQGATLSQHGSLRRNNDQSEGN